MHACREPYISPDAFRGITFYLSLLLLGVTVVSATAHYVQPIYLGALLGYDSINSIDLNYPSLAGVVMGAILAYWVIVRLKWSLRRYFFTNVLFFAAYVMTMYFIAVPATAKEMLYIPVFLLAIGEVMMETGATYALSQHVPFPVFFMNITIIGFVRCGAGTSVGAALIEHSFAARMLEYGLPEAIRECYGIASWVCVGMLTLILLSRFRAVPASLVPRIITVARSLRHHASAG